MQETINKKITVFIVDPSEVMRHGFDFLAQKHGQLHICGAGDNLLQSLPAIAQAQPDVVLLSLGPSPSSVTAEIVSALQNEPQMRILGYADAVDANAVSTLIHAGLRGICSTKAGADLLLAFESIASGALYLSPEIAEVMTDAITNSGKHAEMPEPPPGSPLTKREQDVLELVSRGMTNQQIAQVLNVSVETVKAHIRRIMDKTGMRSRRDLTVTTQKTDLQ